MKTIELSLPGDMSTHRAPECGMVSTQIYILLGINAEVPERWEFEVFRSVTGLGSIVWFAFAQSAQTHPSRMWVH